MLPGLRTHCQKTRIKLQKTMFSVLPNWLLIIAAIILLLVVISFLAKRAVRKRVYPLEFLDRTTHNIESFEKRRYADEDYGYYFYDKGDAAQPLLVLFHGNATSAEKMASVRMAFLREHGYGLAAPEIPGYAPHSKIKPSEARILPALKDFLGQMIREHPDRDVILVGESLGGAYAILAAPQTGNKALVTLAAYTRTHDFMSAAPKFLFDGNQIDALSAAPLVDVPWALVHCSQDTVVPASMQRKLLAAAQTETFDLYAECVDHGVSDALILQALEKVTK